MKQCGFILLCVALLILAGACGTNSPLIVTATPASADPRLVEEATLPPMMVANTQQEGGIVTATPVLAATQPSACPVPEKTRPSYTLQTHLTWGEYRLQTEQTVRYVNTTGQSLENLVFQVEPNRFGGLFVLQGVMMDGASVEDVKLEASRLTVALPHVLPPFCQVEVALSFSLKIPSVLDGYYGRFGYFGHTARQVNLGHWFPVLAPYVVDEWQVPRPHIIGEQTIAELSDFEVTLTLENAPQTVNLTGGGLVQRQEGQNWKFTLEGGRDLAISIGNGMQREAQIAPDGTVVEVYSFPQARGDGLNPAAQALNAALEALSLYEELFGLPYPHARLVVVEGDFPDGMEFSGLVFVGEAWFRTWRGKPNEWLTIITVHEVAHQWWYMLVGNNPAEYPYLDEAFATYSEYLYFQRFYGDQTEWWWNFRVRGYDIAESRVDTNIYLYDDGRPYINAVYLRGAEMLHSLRESLGDEAFFAWLRSYAESYQGQIATPRAFWGILSPASYEALLPLRQTYLAQWGVLPED
jgi:hypothetical protein